MWDRLSHPNSLHGQLELLQAQSYPCVLLSDRVQVPCITGVQQKRIVCSCLIWQSAATSSWRLDHLHFTWKEIRSKQLASCPTSCQGRLLSPVVIIPANYSRKLFHLNSTRWSATQCLINSKQINPFSASHDDNCNGLCNSLFTCSSMAQVFSLLK